MDEDERQDSARLDDRHAQRLRGILLRQTIHADVRSAYFVHPATGETLGSRKEGELVARLVGLMFELDGCEECG